MENRQNIRQPLHSLRSMFGILFFLMMTGTVLLSLLINTIFLEPYYKTERKNALIHVYRELQNASVEDLLETDDFDLTLRESLRRSNVSLLILDSNTRTVKAWSADESLMEDRLYANLFGMTPFREEEGRDSRPGIPADDLEEEEDDYYDDEYVITQVLEEKNPYSIYVVQDRFTRSKSLEMWGSLGEGSFFLLRSPLEDIRGSAMAANRFFGYIAIILSIAGTILAWWLSRRITDPVRQLTEISIRMKDLDFSAKYRGGSRTELDTLGRNMNELSQKLEETISALRTANNDLQRDLDRRNRQEEMRQEFLSNVTHELKTPIALVRGYAEGLQDGIAEDPESRAFYLETILEESDRMNTIVQKVLQLNQLEFGDGAVSMERFDIVDMIRNYLENASLLARQAGVSLFFSQEEPVYVWGDPFLIQEVIQNYYSNALHHAEEAPSGPSQGASLQTPLPQTPPTLSDGKTYRDETASIDPLRKVIDIRCEQHEEHVRVTVFNTGKPIPEDALPHIWEKFYKVDKARTRAYGGSGVGLSIVKAIMDLHHRGYGAENYENGVAFWFELDRSGPDDESGTDESPRG